VDIRCKLGVSSSNQSHHNDNGKAKKEKGDTDSDPIKRGVDPMGMGLGLRHVEILVGIYRKESRVKSTMTTVRNLFSLQDDEDGTIGKVVRCRKL
jgi:hypothetical protein